MDVSVVYPAHAIFTYINDDRYGANDLAPSRLQGVDVTALEPDWEQVATDGTFAWHDHRTHWMSSTPPDTDAPEKAEGPVSRPGLRPRVAIRSGAWETSMPSIVEDVLDEDLVVAAPLGLVAGQEPTPADQVDPFQLVPRDLPVPGRDLPGVHYAMEFLTQQNKRNAGDDEAKAAPNGTGPFKLQKYTPSAEVRLVANRDYFRDGMPKLDKVVMRIIPEPANQVIALESGEVDWLFGVLSQTCVSQVSDRPCDQQRPTASARWMSLP